MSDEAIMIDKNGNRTLITSDELRPKDYGNAFICSGIREEDGKCCAIPMRPTEGAGVRKVYFYPERRDRPHISDCPCAKPRKQITVESLDRLGAGKTDVDLYARISYKKPDRGNGAKQKSDGFGSDPELPEEHLPAGGEEDEREIRMKKRMPKNLREVILLLQSLDTRDTYMSRQVYDWILDERTVYGYRRTEIEIQIGKPFVVMCRKALPRDYGITLENNQWLLKDYWASGRNRRNPILFILNVDAEAKSKLYNLCLIDPPVKIAVFAIFRKHPNWEKTYISYPINAQLITAYTDDPNS